MDTRRTMMYLSLIITSLVLASLICLAEDTPRVTIQDLAWLVVGLSDLTETGDQDLAVSEDQAAQLFPVLRELREDGILGFAEGQDGSDDRVFIQPGGAARGGGGMRGLVSMMDQSESGDDASTGRFATRGEVAAGSEIGASANMDRIEARMSDRGQRMNDAMDQVLLVLTLDQCNYILNMEFDASEYGLSGSEDMVIGPDLSGARRALEEARARAEAFDRRVVELLKILAALAGSTYEEAE